MRIKELNKNARPMEKLVELGERSLSNVELLAILLGTGTKELSAIELANQILNKYTLNEFVELSYDKLISIKGLKISKATKILASIELAKRSMQRNNEQMVFSKARDIYNYLIPILSNKKIELLYIMYVDAKARLLNLYLADEGDLANVNVPIRKIIAKALEINAYGIFMIHNHPTGSVLPSNADFKSTISMIKACRLVEIEFIDHIICGFNDYYSFFENNDILSIEEDDYEENIF